MSLAVANPEWRTRSAPPRRSLTRSINRAGFSTLEDIRTLAKAEAARRFHPAAPEAAQVAAFRTRQRLLFEPDIALNFHRLRHQEHLKPLYRKDARYFPGGVEQNRIDCGRDRKISERRFSGSLPQADLSNHEKRRESVYPRRTG